MFETRKQRLLRLQHERSLRREARKLRAAQEGAWVALGARALIPHGAQRSRYFYKP